MAGSLEAAPPLERTGGIGESRPPSYQSVPAGNIVDGFVLSPVYLYILLENSKNCAIGQKYLTQRVTFNVKQGNVGL